LIVVAESNFLEYLHHDRSWGESCHDPVALAQIRHQQHQAAFAAIGLLHTPGSEVANDTLAPVNDTFRKDGAHEADNLSDVRLHQIAVMRRTRPMVREELHPLLDAECIVQLPAHQRADLLEVLRFGGTDARLPGRVRGGSHEGSECPIYLN